ncbi:MAG TPA: hypothetical protein P5186_20300 [Candidatus Paceibacterota bacterium]|nr:hypothetical protein [Candidatus Paceibacterota bacterium]
MNPILPTLAAAVAVTVVSGLHAAESSAAAGPWKIIIANDTCPDVTWGFTEAQVRASLAELIRAHLDEMNRSDAGPAENRNHYNLMAFVEAEAFFEKYPERKEEFIRRAREGRICLTPFLCNTLWGWQSSESVLRAFSPAHRFAREHGIALDVANHTELPSLPWGMATILAGCGFRWVNVPFLDYDCTFKALQNPPLFRLEGPDGSDVRVLLDPWASRKANYTQGGHLLQDTKRLATEWLPHYEQLGASYPLRTIFASGTHSDINPNSWKQARAFADRIIAYNSTGTNAAKLVNGTLAQFCREVDAAEQATPFLPKLRGCFGHSWELWPVSLAQTVAAARENERAFLVAESLVALATRAEPDLAARTRTDRVRAEWCWAMLADHAWNGTDLKNKRHNAQLRRQWADELGGLSHRLTARAWSALGLKPDPAYLTVFNPLSFTQDIFVSVEGPAGVTGVAGLTSGLRLEGGLRRLSFVAPRVPPLGFREFRLDTTQPLLTVNPPFSATTDTLEGPFYRVRVDLQNGGLGSVVHKPTGQELVLRASGRSLGQTVFHEGREQTLTNIECRTQFDGCIGELRITGRAGDLRVTNVVMLHAALDRLDLDIRIEKPPTTNEQRLLHFFPVNDGAKDLRIETPAAVVRPRPQPDGDLLPGADTRRFAVQGFVDVSPAGRTGVTIALRDAFLLRLDQGAPAFEALGNDQNWKEVTQDQDGVRHFRFRYSLRAHAPGYDNAAAVAWSRADAAPGVFALGRLSKAWLDRAHLSVDPTRAIATCFKPADDGHPGKIIVRLWETSGRSSPLELDVPGLRRVGATDLLERAQDALELEGSRIRVPVRGFGLAGVALEH